MPASVLIVDDIAPNIRLLTAQLEREYFHVYTAQSGQKAVDIVNEHKPDIVLLDIMMPGMSGFEVCSLIKGDPDTQHIPVILVTALDDLSAHQEGYDCGANDILMKPVDHKTLKSQILFHLNLKLLGDSLLAHSLTANHFDMPPPDRDVIKEKMSGQILLVGSSTESIIPYEKSLLKDKHSITSVDNLERAYHILDAQNFDCIFTTPDVNWCKAVQLKAASIGSPNVLVSFPESQKEQLMAYLHAGQIDDLLPQDFGYDSFRARISTHMQQRQIISSIHNYTARADIIRHLKDPLTKHFSQEYGEHYCQSYLDDIATPQQGFGVLVINIDQLDQINAHFGINTGNQILEQMGGRLSLCCPPYIMIMRLTDKDFCLAFPNIHRNQMFRMAYYAHQYISERPYGIDTNDDFKTIQLSVSVGGCLENLSDKPDFKDMIDRSDLASYEAKDLGGDCIYFEGMGHISKANIA